MLVGPSETLPVEINCRGVPPRAIGRSLQSGIDKGKAPGTC